METKAPFFRLGIVVLLVKVPLAFLNAVSKLAFSVTVSLWQNRKVSMTNTPVSTIASYSCLEESNLSSGCGFAEGNRGNKQTSQVDFALLRNKSTRKEKEES